MTTSEFKEQNPHLSHLEGNDLWNAMEDNYLLANENDVEKPITDWKGNIIKVGDEICIIKVIDREYFRFNGIFIGGKFIENTEPPKPNTECFEVGEYITVEPNLMYTTKIGEYTFHQHLSMLNFAVDSCHIIAIKGISDTK